MYFFEYLFLKGYGDCFHGNDKKMVTSHTCFHSVKQEVLFLAMKLCK